MDSAREIDETSVGNYIISGYKGDYIFEVIRKSKQFYENDVLERWREYISAKRVIYDIGANIGNHTLFFAHENPQARIYSFEPIEQTYEILTRNCTRNHLEHVTPIRMAVGDERGTLMMKIDNDNLGASKVSESGNESVCCDAIDNMDLPLPDMVKIDVEDFELSVLKGMSETLKKAKPVIWVETSSEALSVISAFLGHYGYNIADYSKMNVLFSTESALSAQEAAEDHLALTQQIWQREERVKTLLNSAQEINDRNLKYQNKQKELLTSLKDKKKQLAEAALSRRELLSDLEQRRAQLTEVTESRRELLSDLEQSKARLAETVESRHKLLSDLATLRAKIADVEQSRARVKDELNSIKRELAAAVEHSDMLRQDIARRDGLAKTVKRFQTHRRLSIAALAEASMLDCLQKQADVYSFDYYDHAELAIIDASLYTSHIVEILRRYSEAGKPTLLVFNGSERACRAVFDCSRWITAFLLTQPEQACVLMKIGLSPSQKVYQITSWIDYSAYNPIAMPPNAKGIYHRAFCQTTMNMLNPYKSYMLETIRGFSAYPLNIRATQAQAQMYEPGLQYYASDISDKQGIREAAFVSICAPTPDSEAETLLLESMASLRSVVGYVNSPIAEQLAAFIHQPLNAGELSAWISYMQTRVSQTRQLRLQALRSACMASNVYTLYRIARQVGAAKDSWRDCVEVLARVKTLSEAESVIQSFNRQTWDAKRLLLIADDELPIASDACVRQRVASSGDLLSDVTACGRVAVFSPGDYYGPDYLRDMMQAFLFTETDVVCAQTEVGNAWRLCDQIVPYQSVFDIDAVLTMEVRALVDSALMQIKALCIDTDQIELPVDEAAPKNAMPCHELHIEADGEYQDNLRLENPTLMDNDDIGFEYGAISINLTYFINETFATRMCGRALIYTHNEDTHRYLLPSCFKAKRISLPPETTLLPSLRPGSVYDAYFRGIQAPGQSAQLMLRFFNVDDDELVHVANVFLNVNTQITIPDKATRVVAMIRVSGKGTLVVGQCELRECQDAIIDIHSPESRPVMIITNNYPSKDNLYANMFTHRRVVAYKRNGVITPIVFVLRKQGYGKLARYEYEGVLVQVGNHQELINEINRVSPRALLLHFAPDSILKSIADGDIRLPVLCWLHGADCLPAYSRLYIDTSYRRMAQTNIDSIMRMGFIQKMLTLDNVRFVSVSQALNEQVCRYYNTPAHDIKSTVIHNFIDNEIFTYVKKDIEQRKVIVSVKTYQSHVYAPNLVTDAILELSKRPCFNDLTFYIYGRGRYFFESVEPLLGFANVQIRNEFLSSDQMARLYHRCGIMLMPSRYDTHGVSRDEARACGVVAITNPVGAIGEFVSPEDGVLTPPEDCVAIADAVERLYTRPDEFALLSERGARRVRWQLGMNETIGREIALIEETISASEAE